MDRGLENPVKHLKLPRKKHLAKNNSSLELFPKDVTMFDRDVNTGKLLNTATF